MRPARNLGNLSRVAGRRLLRLKARATAALASGVPGPERDKHIGYVVLETQNLWSNFVRSYLLSLAVSPKRGLGGRVTLGNLTVTTPGAVLHEAAKAVKGPLAAAPTSRREEPPWHDVSTFLKTCVNLKPSNEAHIRASLSLQTRVFYDLPTFRNFYAHRNEESARRAVDMARHQYLITKVTHPTAALSKAAIKRPQPLLLDWLDEAGAVMDLLCD